MSKFALVFSGMALSETFTRIRALGLAYPHTKSQKTSSKVLLVVACGIEDVLHVIYVFDVVIARLLSGRPWIVVWSWSREILLAEGGV
ncbi:hypothetical protein ACJX0J_025446, partial [Zea mays]